jgi:hypothetical protein
MSDESRYFLSELVVRDVAEGRETTRLRLLEPFWVWSDVLNDQLVIPAGFECDGESIPRALHGLVPPFGMSKRAAVVHDYLYRNHGYLSHAGPFKPVTRQQADAVYQELCLAKGLPRWRATVRWATLRLVGWKAWAALLCLLLSACSNDIAGLSRNERLTLYGTALTLAGQPEFGAIAYGLRKPVTDAKQPREVTP